MGEKRIYPRTSVKLKVLITHTCEEGEFVFLLGTKDISDGGIFLVHDEVEYLPPVGSVVDVQVQELAIEAPVVKMEVVRTAGDGIGLRFVGEI